MDERRILVVEDERTIADSVAARLRAEGFAVQIAGDGPAGVEAFARGRPDLVVLDVMLPGFDGLEVCRRIQADRPVPVLMLTARDDETDLLVGLAVGADDYLTKPFSLRELAARVHALLRRQDRAAAGAAPRRAAQPGLGLVGRRQRHPYGRQPRQGAAAQARRGPDPDRARRRVRAGRAAVSRRGSEHRRAPATPNPVRPPEERSDRRGEQRAAR